MSIDVNPVASITNDPAKLVTNMAKAYLGIGTALETLLNENKELSSAERQAQKAKKAAALNAVVQTIEGMISRLEQGEDNHLHVQALTAIQKNLAISLSNHGHDDHHDHHIETAASMAFAMAHSITRNAQSNDDDGPETLDEHAGHAASHHHQQHGHAAKVSRRKPPRPADHAYDSRTPFAVGSIIPKHSLVESRSVASPLLSRPDGQPDNRIGAHDIVMHGALDALAHKVAH